MYNRTKHFMRASVLVLAVTLWRAALGAEVPCPPVATMPTPAQLQEAQRQARNRGALWRLEKNGRSGYLYGTLHVGKLEWAMPGRTVGQALREAEIIAVELDPTDPAVQHAMTAPQTPAETPELPEPLWDRLRAQASKACVPWERLQGMPPMMILTTLALLDARWEGLDPSYASEFVLTGFARSAGKEVALLETPSIQRDTLVGMSPVEQTAAIERNLSELESGANRERIRAIAEAWAEGDLDRLERYGADENLAPQATIKRLVWDRNPGIAARIEELHDSGRRMFAAVGILHMLGAYALPKLLAERGFKVERVGFGAD
jgi:uncharacterized protein YbaP (TraB family)